MKYAALHFSKRNKFVAEQVSIAARQHFSPHSSFSKEVFSQKKHRLHQCQKFHSTSLTFSVVRLHIAEKYQTE
jgi:hypothetical protein